MTEANSLSLLFKRFSFQIFILLSATIIFVAGISLFLEYRTVHNNNQKNLKLFANEIRESILRRQDLIVIEKSLRLFSDENVSSIKVTSGESVIFQNLKNTSLIRSHETENLFFDADQTKIAGQIEVEYSYGFLLITGMNISILYAILLLVLLFLVRRFLNQLDDQVIKPIHTLSDQFSNSETKMPHPDPLPLAAKEIQQMQTSYTTMANRIDDYQKKMLEQTQAAAFSALARQVSHDIRSPLTALNMILESLHLVPEDKRLIIRNSVGRINDIANTLLSQARKISSEMKKQNDQAFSPIATDVALDVELLPALVDVLVSEKRVQFRNKAGVEIDCDLRESYGAFAKINSTELKRLLSNLVNNSIEALPDQKGKITISVRANYKNVQLFVQDNGNGIPKEILEKLGGQGVSFGKEGQESGSGLGVYHAKTSIESMGGSFQINSQLGSGTLVTISLPRASTPEWFVAELKLAQDQTVVILDDDSSIHQIWQGRIKSLGYDSKVHLISFSSGDDFKAWVGSNNIDNLLYLVDFELLGQKQTGLDLIEELKISSHAILVTSRYEEAHIRKRTKNLNLKLIPKGMAGFVPITLSKIEKKIRYDLCLLDDDKTLVQAVWEMVAKTKGHNIIMFSTTEEFQSAADSIDRETPIFIDISLGNGVSGVDFSEVVHKMGFLNINLATGYSADSINAPSFVGRIIGKDYPEDI